MKSTLNWKEGFKSTLNDNRGHEITIDLPENLNGSDLGTTALELCAMSLNGCIGTIFAMTAKKMQLEFSELKVELEALKNDTPTINTIEYTFSIKSNEDTDKIQKCLDLTEKNCPVGIIFSRAGIEIKGKLVKL